MYIHKLYNAQYIFGVNSYMYIKYINIYCGIVTMCVKIQFRQNIHVPI